MLQLWRQINLYFPSWNTIKIHNIYICMELMNLIQISTLQVQMLYVVLYKRIAYNVKE